MLKGLLIGEYKNLEWNEVKKYMHAQKIMNMDFTTRWIIWKKNIRSFL